MFKAQEEVVNYQRLTFITALHLGDLATIVTFTTRDRSWLTRDLDRKKLRAVHIAVRHLNILRYLLDADPTQANQKDSFDETPLMYAALSNQPASLQLLVDRGVPLGLENAEGRTALYWATLYGYKECVQILIKAGALSAEKKPRKYHYIHLAASRGYLEIVQCFLENDSNLLNIEDDKHQTSLYWAANEGHFSVVQYLVDRGANLSFETGPENKEQANSPLAAALQKGHPLCIEILQKSCEKALVAELKNRSDLKKHIDTYGQKYLYRAVSEGFVDLLRLLESYGIDINCFFTSNKLPLHVAAEYGRLGVVQFYLERDRDLLNSADVYNQTALLLAAAKGHGTLVQFLLGEGAELNVAVHRFFHKHHKKTPLDMAYSGAHIEVANLIILELFSQGSTELAINSIKEATQVFELIHANPSLRDPLFQNSRIEKLVAFSPNCKKDRGTYSFYKEKGKKRNSFFGSIDLKSGKITQYEPIKKLGQGSYGVVRMFENREGERLAVKSINKDFSGSKDQITKQKKDWNNEAHFMKRAYPNSGIAEVFHFTEDIADTRSPHSNYRYNNRLAMPYFKGESVSKFLNKITNIDTFALVILEISRELHRLHTIGIIHGDIKENNLIISEKEGSISVKFIDFGWAYEEKASSGRILALNSRKCYAPERIISSTPTKPHFNQDIYSYGAMLKALLKEHLLGPEIQHLFPCIKAFSKQAQSITPANRPTLDSFIEQLSQELYMDLSSSLTI